ncbi:aspartate aminotransferase family protein [Neotabrizicola shimadae]|uniref:Aminotransferase class III-fold pyridoxal phosphate-dependent enzyme n=1 Tax=Neotabrizicola shimadae TaxID=2807096 RepID=A0A8G0ZV11_9RHOB|nr:aminotransferase class III-fold pyridoxal phosphate-dependent enzyme [Neotabrizicola shimadae]QYZ69352.1 aminotransferase class III-fold pyridoxal phosphate-dependent enzyme [Neotabrizicola shimadae]
MSDLMKRRRDLLGPNVSTFYDDPVHLVRGEGVWLWDAAGRRYLDCYNNVPHVGHCNPRVVDAIAAQARTLNTHTRYLHEGILDYVERLTATFADPLKTAILTCSGSEANDIALRMAEAMTGKRGIVATDATYHGNTTLVSHLSRSNIPEVGFGLAGCFRHVEAPDSYRIEDPDGQRFAARVQEAIDDLEASGTGFAALVVCPLFLNEGFPTQAEGWLRPAAEAARRAGGLLICDEVQSGFGRCGSHFWAHQKQGVVPDVVTLGKPMGNGHPVAGLVTSPEIMARFRTAFRYFNTFGGNPVSCAAAMAVLDELQSKDLQANARHIGLLAQDRLRALAAKHEVIGDVRQAGMVFGAEFVLDRATKAPAADLADRVVNAMRLRGILLSKLGRHKNTLKIRPPMPFDESHLDLLMTTLDIVLTETAVQG